MGLPKKQKLINTKEVLIPKVDDYNDKNIDWVEEFKKKYETKEEHGFIYTELFTKNKNMRNSLEHIEVLHEDNHKMSKFICLFKKNPTKIELEAYKDQNLDINRIPKQFFGNYEEICRFFEFDVYVDEEDIYMTPNTFLFKKRNSLHIWHFRAIYVDLDIEKAGLTREQVDKALKKKIEDGIIPPYTLKNETGRGYHLIWRIEDAPASALYSWQEVEDRVIELLVDLGADKSVNDCSRVLRVPGTINSKNKKMCIILENTNRMYMLRNLHDVLGLKAERERNKQNRLQNKAKDKTDKKTVLHRLTPYSLHYARRNDILTICHLRGWDMRGHREKVLFLYRYWTCIFVNDKEISLDETLDINSRFKYPLSESEVEAATRSAEGYYDDYVNSKGEVRMKVSGKYMGFNPRNETLIKFLDITPEEQKHLKTIIDKNEKNNRDKEVKKKKRRNEKGLTAKQQEIILRNEKIQELKKQGYKQKEVAKFLKLNLKMVKRSWS